MGYDWNRANHDWAVITGASEGIGRAIAFELAARKVRLVLCARRQTLLEELAGELRARFNIETMVVSADLGTMAGLVFLKEKTDGLDVGFLIAAAGYGQSVDFLKGYDEADMVAVNCTASAVLVRHYGAQMASRKRGAIILFSSIVAFQGAPFSANYAATKAYIQTLAEGLYHEFKPYNVSVVCVAPGPVDTGFAARANMLMGKAETAETVAKATVNAIGNSFLVRPGFLGKLLGYSLGMLPRSLRVVIMGRIMGASVNRGEKPNAKA